MQKKSLVIVSIIASATQAISCGVPLYFQRGPANGSGESLSPPSTITLVTGQSASVVIGQPDFTSTGAGSSLSQISFAYGPQVTAGGVLFLSDYGNARVLGFNSVPTSSGASADFVLGGGWTPANGDFGGPAGLTLRGDEFWVADFGGSRIVKYNQIPTSAETLANVVIGATGFGVWGPGTCAQNEIAGPLSVRFYGGKMIVADWSSNRILIYNSVPTSTGLVNADLVLGQPNFVTCGANTGGVSGSSMFRPSDVWTNGTKLIVYDSGNYRILIWNTFPTDHGQPADLVLGQATTTTNLRNMGLESPTAQTLDNADVGNFNPLLYSNGIQLVAPDPGNNRVLVWNTIPTASYTAADVVIGQLDFVTATAASPPTAASLKSPDGIFIDSQRLIVGDSGNQRYLIYNSQ